ncbi:type V CRISPR-associated protein C2c8 [Chroococcus sp. FPU101]|uniref:type V CRISPR-associated protein C2c8 n=1 Tax=Chroococcus sp. FPU101 TaxID=1974212 RepID=UPI001A909953|nr:type V CRISPR-associated protein C2c8 [Chroococcus sp. FPU101]GFE71811.1 transposase IS605 OrfB [Chroococcus sp. FPU101]
MFNSDLAPKTIEFKLDLTKAQQQIVDSWLNSMRWVWNEGLSLLLEHQSLKYYEWLEKQLNLQRLPTEGIEKRRVSFSKKGFSATCQISSKKGDRFYPCCSLPLPPSPRLKGDGYKFLVGWLTRERYREQSALYGVPMKFVSGTLKHLADSWKAYKDKTQLQRHLPKFKSYKRGERITSLYCLQPENIKVKPNGVICPGVEVLGELKIVNKGLLKRWDFNIKPRTLQICKRPSGYYLQLMSNFPILKVKDSDRACGLDVGLQYIYSDDAGKQVDPPKYYRQSQKRLRRLQRKLARQVDNSSNQQKTKDAIARLHEKVAMRRRNFNHKLSTYVVRSFGGIAVEDLKISNLVRRPKPKKLADDEGYERNNAKAKSGLNKSFADAGLSQLLTMIEVKAKVADRELVKVNPAYSSQECPSCQNIIKKSLSQRTHQCLACGYLDPRDVASAIVIRSRADFVRSYRACTRNVKPVELSKVATEKQEPEKSGYVHVVNTTLSFSPLRPCGDAEEKLSSISTETNSSFSFEVIQPSLIPSAIGQLFDPKAFGPPKRNRKKWKKISQPNFETCAAQNDSGIQLSLSLWDSTGEIELME